LHILFKNNLKLNFSVVEWINMTMTPDTAAAVPRFEDCVSTDPVFAALQKEREAFQTYSDILAGLARVAAFSSETPSDDLLEQQVAGLPNLEAAEANASAALVEAEQELLATKPASIQGAAALLGFLRKHLSEDPDINPVLEALGNIQTLLNGSDSSCVVRYNRGYL